LARLYGLYHIYETDGLGVFEVHPDGSNLQLFPFYNTIDGGGRRIDAGQRWQLLDGDYTGSSGYGDIISLSLPMGRCSRRLHLSAHWRRLAPIQP
jgi:hypothetical protein